MNDIPNVHVAADTVGRTDLLHFLNSLDRIIKLLVINSFQFTFFKCKTKLFASFLGHLF